MRNKLLVSILILCIIATSSVAAFAYENTDKGSLFTVKANVDGIDIVSSQIDSEYYLFLPASADLTKLALTFESNKYDMSSASIWGTYGGVKQDEYIDITATTKVENNGSYELRVVTDDGAQFFFYIFKGSVIPTMYLTSENASKNRDWVDQSKENKTKGTMLMVDAEGNAVYDGVLTQIKGRGNSTFRYFDKKPYQIKLDEKTDLLDTGDKEKTWVLLANALDASLMHDKLMKDLAAEVGMKYSPSCDWVNLYYDGEYRGVYLLSEKASLGGAGVDIADMEDAYEEINESYGDDAIITEGKNSYGNTIQYTENLNEIENITGGYLLELNRDNYDEASGFITSIGKGFNIKGPEYLSKEAACYISEYYQGFEDALFIDEWTINKSGYNEETGKYFYEYIDFTSLVKSFMLQEFAQNPDAYYASTFFYKDADSIMYQGPIWDQDLAFGSGWGAYVSPSWEMEDYLEEALKEVPLFQNAVKDYYSTQLKDELYALLEEGGVIDTYKATLEDNAKMNYVIWPYNRNGGKTYEERLWEGQVNYDIVIDDLKWYITERLAILDERYGAETVTRSTFINRLAQLSDEEFTLAEGEHWYELGLNWAVSNNISDGTNPYSEITREQIATMLFRFAGEPETEGSLDVFTDGNKVSSWAQEAMEWAVAEGIFQGYGDGTLRPKHTATTNEVAKIIENYMTRN